MTMGRNVRDLPGFRHDPSNEMLMVIDDPPNGLTYTITWERLVELLGGTAGTTLTAPEIRDLLQTLQAEARLDASAIKNLPSPPNQLNIYELLQMILREGANVTLTPDDVNSTLTVSSSGGGAADDFAFMFGADAPDDASGNNGDVYVRTSNGAFYRKASDMWGSPFYTDSTFAPNQTNIYDAVKAIMVHSGNQGITADDANHEIDVTRAATEGLYGRIVTRFAGSTTKTMTDGNDGATDAYTGNTDNTYTLANSSDLNQWRGSVTHEGTGGTLTVEGAGLTAVTLQHGQSVLVARRNNAWQTIKMGNPAAPEADGGSAEGNQLPSNPTMGSLFYLTEDGTFTEPGGTVNSINVTPADFAGGIGWSVIPGHTAGSVTGTRTGILGSRQTLYRNEAGTQWRIEVIASEASDLANVGYIRANGFFLGLDESGTIEIGGTTYATKEAYWDSRGSRIYITGEEVALQLFNIATAPLPFTANPHTSNVKKGWYIAERHNDVTGWHYIGDFFDPADIPEQGGLTPEMVREINRLAKQQILLYERLDRIELDYDAFGDAAEQEKLSNNDNGDSVLVDTWVATYDGPQNLNFLAYQADVPITSDRTVGVTNGYAEFKLQFAQNPNFAGTTTITVEAQDAQDEARLRVSKTFNNNELVNQGLIEIGDHFNVGSPSHKVFAVFVKIQINKSTAGFVNPNGGVPFHVHEVNLYTLDGPEEKIADSPDSGPVRATDILPVIRVNDQQDAQMLHRTHAEFKEDLGLSSRAIGVSEAFGHQPAVEGNQLPYTVVEIAHGTDAGRLGWFGDASKLDAHNSIVERFYTYMNSGQLRLNLELTGNRTADWNANSYMEIDNDRFEYRTNVWDAGNNKTTVEFNIHEEEIERWKVGDFAYIKFVKQDGDPFPWTSPNSASEAVVAIKPESQFDARNADRSMFPDYQDWNGPKVDVERDWSLVVREETPGTLGAFAGHMAVHSEGTASERYSWPIREVGGVVDIHSYVQVYTHHPVTPVEVNVPSGFLLLNRLLLFIPTLFADNRAPTHLYFTHEDGETRILPLTFLETLQSGVFATRPTQVYYTEAVSDDFAEGDAVQTNLQWGDDTFLHPGDPDSFLEKIMTKQQFEDAAGRNIIGDIERELQALFGSLHTGDHPDSVAPVYSAGNTVMTYTIPSGHYFITGEVYVQKTNSSPTHDGTITISGIADQVIPWQIPSGYASVGVPIEVEVNLQAEADLVLTTAVTHGGGTAPFVHDNEGGHDLTLTVYNIWEAIGSSIDNVRVTDTQIIFERVNDDDPIAIDLSDLGGGSETPTPGTADGVVSGASLVVSDNNDLVMTLRRTNALENIQASVALPASVAEDARVEYCTFPSISAAARGWSADNPIGTDLGTLVGVGDPTFLSRASATTLSISGGVYLVRAIFTVNAPNPRAVPQFRLVRDSDDDEVTRSNMAYFRGASVEGQVVLDAIMWLIADDTISVQFGSSPIEASSNSPDDVRGGSAWTATVADGTPAEMYFTKLETAGGSAGGDEGVGGGGTLQDLAYDNGMIFKATTGTSAPASPSNSSYAPRTRALTVDDSWQTNTIAPSNNQNIWARSWNAARQANDEYTITFGDAVQIYDGADETVAITYYSRSGIPVSSPAQGGYATLTINGVESSPLSLRGYSNVTTTVLASGALPYTQVTNPIATTPNHSVTGNNFNLDDYPLLLLDVILEDTEGALKRAARLMVPTSELRTYHGATTLATGQARAIQIIQDGNELTATVIDGSDSNQATVSDVYVYFDLNLSRGSATHSDRTCNGWRVFQKSNPATFRRYFLTISGVEL